MSTEETEKLDEIIREEMGIDLQKYRNEDAVASLVSLLIFPLYVITWVIGPLLLALVFFVLGFSLLDLVHVEYLLFGTIGLLLFVSIGLLSGLLLLTWKMKSDIWSIIEYSVDIAKAAGKDAKKAGNHFFRGRQRNASTLLFKGVIHIVTVPLMARAVSRKVPLIGGVVSMVVANMLGVVANRIKFKRDELIEEESEEAQTPLAAQRTTLPPKKHSFLVRGKEILDKAFSVARFPLKVGLVLSMVLLGLLIYLIN